MPVRLRARDHTYWRGKQWLPGVTSILTAVGAKPAGPPPGVTADEWNRAGALGRAVHAATALDDQGALNPASVHPDVAPRLEAWRMFRRETGFTPCRYGIECIVGRSASGAAGTLDRIGTWSDGSPDQYMLLDIKTSSADAAWWELQLGGYADLADRRTAKLVTVRLGADGVYHIREWDTETALSGWSGVLAYYYWMLNHGLIDRPAPDVAPTPKEVIPCQPSLL